MSSNNNEDRPSRRIRRKVEYSPKKALQPLVIPSAPPPSPASFSQVANFNIHNKGFPKLNLNLPPLYPTPLSSETRQDSPSPVLLNAVDDDVRRSENNQIEGGEKEETKDDWERRDQLKSFHTIERNIPRYKKNLPPPPPTPETHQDSPSSPMVILKPSDDEIEAKERQERFDTLVECAVNEYYANKRTNVFDLNLPPPPESHQDSPPSPVVVMNSSRRTEEREERFEALLDVVKWALKGKKYFDRARRGVKMAAIFDNVPTKRRSPRQIKINQNWMNFYFPLK